MQSLISFFKKVYEDNALGRLPDKRYEMLSAGYEKNRQNWNSPLRHAGSKVYAV